MEIDKTVEFVDDYKSIPIELGNEQENGNVDISIDMNTLLDVGSEILYDFVNESYDKDSELSCLKEVITPENNSYTRMLISQGCNNRDAAILSLILLMNIYVITR